MKSKLGSNDEVNECVYMLLQTMPQSDTGFKYFFLGHGLCKAAFLEVLGIGTSRLTRLTDWLRAGNVHPPRDLCHSTLKDAPQFDASVAMLQWAYDVLAEPINSSDVMPSAEDVELVAPPSASPVEPIHVLPTIDGYKEWVYGPGATTSQSAAHSGEVRWLPPMPLIDLYELCVQSGLSSSDVAPSYVSFTRAYKDKFKSSLRFRPDVGLHSKCDACEKYKLMRKHAVTPEAASRVRAEHFAHIKATFLDRSIDECVQAAAREAVNTHGGVVAFVGCLC